MTLKPEYSPSVHFRRSVPLPALGGACELKYVQKVQADVYMDLRARNTPMRVMPDYAAIASGNN